MENTKQPSLFQPTLTWGLITSIAGIVYTLILYFLGSMTNKPLQYAGIIITIVCLYFGIKSIRDQSLNGIISFGKSLGTGVLISLYSTIISMIFMVILYTVIDPGLVDITLQDSIDQMTARGMSDDQIEQGIAMTKKFFVPFMIIGGTFFGVLTGTVVSLILSIFLKKEMNPFVDENSNQNS